MTEITHEALEALSKKATPGLIEVLLPDTEYDHGVPLIATDYPGTFGPSNGLVLWATMQPTEIEAKDTECAEANAAFAAALWNAYRTGQLILAQPSGDEVEAARKFSLGDRVTKTKGSSWTGLVVGFYSTSLTPIGYAVESENEPGSVQVYPESALEACVKARENSDG